MFNLENINYYRKGYVVKETLDNLYCCHIAEVTNIIFSYIEIVYEDGKRIFIYEDPETFEYVEKNFVKNRFTSFCELFTTDELAVEDRGFVQLDYYVRRSKEDYLIMPISEALIQLQDINCKDDRIVKYNQYDENVDYHL